MHRIKKAYGSPQIQYVTLYGNGSQDLHLRALAKNWRKILEYHVFPRWKRESGIMKRTENVRDNLPSLHPSPISFPDCLPSLYFWSSTNIRLKQQNIIHFLSNTKPKFELSVIVMCRGTWRWLFKWKRVKPLTFIVRIIAFGVASADKMPIP